MPRSGNEALYSSLETRLNNLRDCAGEGCHVAEWASPPLPETTIDSGPSGQVDTNSASFAFSSSTLAATFECSLDGEAFSECSSPQEYASLADGKQNFRVMATDAAGKVEPPPASRDWTVDTSAPAKCTTTGTSANDIISGTSGDDVICGGVGNDTIDGGLGTDTASYSASLTAVVASLATNSSTGEGSDTFLGMENLLGSPKGDTLTGSDANNTLTGGGSNDIQNGGLGNDKVVGSGGADTLNGQDGADAINPQDGVNGNDSLDGRVGTDTKVTDTTEKFITGFP